MSNKIAFKQTSTSDLCADNCCVVNVAVMLWCQYIWLMTLLLCQNKLAEEKKSGPGWAHMPVD